ncbi:MAG: N-6 DNA methylase, partial [Candidatus Zixiibacteriota bacterium]
DEIEAILNDPDEYRSSGAFVIPEKARWSYILKNAQADNIKVILDDALELLEKTYADKLRGLLPRIYAGSNMEREHVTGLINLFSKDIFRQDHSGLDMLGRVYEYFIGEFASSEGKRGGEYFTPESIVQCLVRMLEPEEGIVYDPCCGSGGMFVQSDIFTHHNHKLSFIGQESKDFTYRLCKMNLFIHGIDGNIQLGNTYTDDKDPRLRLGDEVMPLAPRNANTMWILHFLHHLNEGGTAGFVMATGELSNLEKTRVTVRRSLVEQGYVDCIVQLSGQLFANTQITCALWFLSKNRDGSNGFRKRKDEILFIDGRKLGALILGSRKQRELSEEELEKIVSVYRTFRRDGVPEEVAGFCKVALLDEIREHSYALTPGRYVGTEEPEDEDEPFEVRMPLLLEKLDAEFNKSKSLEDAIREGLRSVGYGA